MSIPCEFGCDHTEECWCGCGECLDYEGEVDGERTVLVVE